MKLRLTIFAPCNGGAVLSEAFFKVVRIGEPFTAPGLFGTEDPFVTVYYKGDSGEEEYKYFRVGDTICNVYTNNLVKQYKLIDK